MNKAMVLIAAFALGPSFAIAEEKPMTSPAGGKAHASEKAKEKEKEMEDAKKGYSGEAGQQKLKDKKKTGTQTN